MTEDEGFVPTDIQYDDREFDYNRARASFAEKMSRDVKDYEDTVGDVLNGIPIPKVTPQEPEFIIENHPVGDNEVPYMNGAMTMDPRSRKYQKVVKPNPNYVSPEMRAEIIAEARKAMPQTTPIMKQAPQTMQAMPKKGMMARLAAIEEALPHETIIGFQMAGGHLQITFE